MATAQGRSARERKQKIFVAVGGLIFLALLAIQLPKLMGGSEPTAAPSTETTIAADGEVIPPVDTAVPVAVTLTDTDRPLRAQPGQLRSFSTFAAKDPFVQQIVSPDATGGDGGGAGSAGAGGGGGGGGNGADKGGPPGGGTTSPENMPSKGFTVGGSAAAAVTIISVNGARQTLVPGAAFPAADPVFVLVAEQPGAKTVVIGVAGGAYASGDRTTKLEVGKPLLLVNTATGARYRLVLVAVGNGTATRAQGPASDEPDGAATP